MENIAVLFVHGIQGSPEQFRFLADTLPASVEVRNLLLPGHGGTVSKFRSSGAADWLGALRAETRELLREGKRILYVGHSMGCLLGLLIARELRNPYAGMLLLCCPFHIRLTGRYLKNQISAALAKEAPRDPFAKASWNANSVKAACPLEYLTCLHPYLELFRLMKQARREAIPEGAVFYFSRQDEIVSPRSRTHVQKRKGLPPEILEGCSHNYFTQDAAKRLAQALQGMLLSPSRGEAPPTRSNPTPHREVP